MLLKKIGLLVLVLFFLIPTLVQATGYFSVNLTVQTGTIHGVKLKTFSSAPAVTVETLNTESGEGPVNSTGTVTSETTSAVLPDETTTSVTSDSPEATTETQSSSMEETEVKSTVTTESEPDLVGEPAENDYQKELGSD